MPNVYFKKRIKDLREKENLSMKQLAELLNVTKSRVNMWENSGTVPRMDTLLKLANHFGVTTDYLLGNDDVSEISGENKKTQFTATQSWQIK